MGFLNFFFGEKSEIVNSKATEFNAEYDISEMWCSRCKNMLSEPNGYYCGKNANADKPDCSSNYIGCTIEEVQKCACIYNNPEHNFEYLGYQENVHDKLPIGCTKCQNFSIEYGKVFKCNRGYDMNISNYELKNTCKCGRGYFDSAEYEKDIDNCY